MKLYSLLILTKNTKTSKHNIETPKKSEIVIFPGRILTYMRIRILKPVIMFESSICNIELKEISFGGQWNGLRYLTRRSW